jgi:hypothetical protein
MHNAALSCWNAMHEAIEHGFFPGTSTSRLGPGFSCRYTSDARGNGPLGAEQQEPRTRKKEEETSHVLRPNPLMGATICRVLQKDSTASQLAVSVIPLTTRIACQAMESKKNNPSGGPSR